MVRPAPCRTRSVRPVAPREAASVILARDASVGVEVLLLQRHPDSRFSPGAFAFPGGRVEGADAAPGVEVRCRGLDRAEAARQLAEVSPPERAIGFWVAALREAFEEAGILLAYGPDERPVDASTLAEARAHRARCREDSARFGQLLAALDLVLATDRVAYWAHWITPEERPIRYDTRFFVATAGRDQVPDPDGHEMVAARWTVPEEALARHRARELVLPLADPAHPSRALRASRRRTRSWRRPAAARSVRFARASSVTQRVERILLPDDPGWF